MLLNCDAAEDSSESLELQGGWTSQSKRKSILNIHWKDWCWSWSSKALATWYEELTQWKRSWCWERLNAGGKVDDRGWDGWMASLTLNGHEFEQSLRDGGGQGSLACYSSWCQRESDMTEQLKNNNPTNGYLSCFQVFTTDICLNHLYIPSVYFSIWKRLYV